MLAEKAQAFCFLNTINIHLSSWKPKQNALLSSVEHRRQSLANYEEDSLDGDSFVSQSRFDAYAQQ